MSYSINFYYGHRCDYDVVKLNMLDISEIRITRGGKLLRTWTVAPTGNFIPTVFDKYWYLNRKLDFADDIGDINSQEKKLVR